MTGCVVVFWAVMMTALVRVEFFPRESRLLPVSLTQIRDRVFKNRNPARLDIVYQNAKIGSINNLEFVPLTVTNTVLIETGTDAPAAYRVTGDVWVNLVIFGAPSRLRLRPIQLEFDRKFELKEFHLQTALGESRAEINGDNAAKELTVSYDLGEGRQTRRVGYADLGNGSALTALGLPGLPSLPGVGALGVLGGGSPAKAIQTMASRLKTLAYFDTIAIGGNDQRAFLVDVKMDQGLGIGAKAWIDEQGNILKVETSFGISFLSSAINTDKLIDRTFERPVRKP